MNFDNANCEIEDSLDDYIIEPGRYDPSTDYCTKMPTPEPVESIKLTPMIAAVNTENRMESSFLESLLKLPSITCENDDFIYSCFVHPAEIDFDTDEYVNKVEISISRENCDYLEEVFRGSFKSTWEINQLTYLTARNGVIALICNNSDLYVTICNVGVNNKCENIVANRIGDLDPEYCLIEDEDLLEHLITKQSSISAIFDYFTPTNFKISFNCCVYYDEHTVRLLSFSIVEQYTPLFITNNVPIDCELIHFANFDEEREIELDTEYVHRTLDTKYTVTEYIRNTLISTNNKYVLIDTNNGWVLTSFITRGALRATYPNRPKTLYNSVFKAIQTDDEEDEVNYIINTESKYVWLNRYGCLNQEIDLGHHLASPFVGYIKDSGIHYINEFYNSADYDRTLFYVHDYENFDITDITDNNQMNMDVQFIVAHRGNFIIYTYDRIYKYRSFRQIYPIY